TLGLVPFALLLGVIAGLVVAQPDFSSTALLVATATTMFFVAGADSKQLLIMLGAGASTLLGVANIVPYMRNRIAIWPDPLSDPLNKGFQTVQSLVALNRGGWLGVGFTRSLQKLHLGRVPHTDYIFAIIAEEFGFIGALAVMALYALWVWRGFRVARSAADSFGRILAVGLVSWVAFQAALNVAVVT
ncbi:MAG: FtsW/RodA/SpoVE family cell cycle protein, partial [Chloroflexi bacterium]|nr:FtsW/RodA/SpoVE family cell cycle protein [Chloroflexota bacterium]